MAFPQDVLSTKVEIYYDNEWHDITSDANGNSLVRGIGAADGEIEITPRGQPDEASSLTTTQAKLSVNNRDGLFSPRNANSTLYGKIGLNTPLRVKTDLSDTRSIVDTFSGTRSNTWGVTDESGHTWVNTTTGSANDFDVASGSGTHSHGANTTPHFSSINTTVGGDPLLCTDFSIVVDSVTAAAAASGDNIEVGIQARIASGGVSYVEARLLFNPSNTILIAIRAFVGGAEVVNTGFAQVTGAVSTDAMSFRFEAVGKTIRMRAWETADTEPTTWLQSTTTTHILPGTISLFSTLHAGNANTKPFLVSYGNFNASLGIILFTGEVAEWPKRWDKTGSDVWVPLVASGITRRKRQGDRPVRSSAFQWATSGLTTQSGRQGLTHYWPLEKQPSQSRNIRDEIDDVELIVALGEQTALTWDSNDFVLGSNMLGTFSNAGATPTITPSTLTVAQIPLPSLGSAPTAWTFGCWVFFPTQGDGTTDPGTKIDFTFDVETFGSTILTMTFSLAYDVATAGEYLTAVITSTGTGSGTWDPATTLIPYRDGPRFVMVHCADDGSGVDVTFYLDRFSPNGALGAIAFRDGSTLTSPFGVPRAMTIAISPYTPVNIGHLMLAMDNDSNLTPLWNYQASTVRAGRGHIGETAVERFERNCEAEGVAYEVIEGELDTLYPTTLGPQRPGRFIDILADTVQADDGILYELRTPMGYGFRTRQSLYGIPDGPAITLDYAATDLGEVPEVTDDDKLTNNIVRTRRRAGGSEFLSIVESGPLGVAIAGDYEVGVVELVVETDAQARDWGQFRTFQGTWDEDRWPALDVYLHRTPFTGNHSHLVSAALLEIGEIISVVNNPTWLGADDVLQQMRSVSIFLSNFNWSLQWTLLPGGPYAALNEFDNPDESRVDTTECSLVDAEDSTTTDFVVVTDLTEGRYDTPFWTRNMGEFSYLGAEGIHLRVNPASRAKGLGGEKVTVAPQADIRDSFNRVASQLAGTNADTGQTWLQITGSATDCVLNGSAAVITHAIADTDVRVALPLGTTHWDHCISVDVAVNFTTCTGGAFLIEVPVRQTDNSNNYMVRLLFSAGSANITMQVAKWIGGAFTQIGNNYAIGANVSGTPIHVKAAIYGRNFYAKVWLGSATEPDWLHKGYNSAPVNEATAQNGERIALRSNRQTGNTNTNASTTWTNLRVWTRQIQPYVWDRFARTSLNDPASNFPDDLNAQFTYFWFTAGSGTQNDFDFTPNQLTMTIPAANGYNAIYVPDVDFLDATASVVWTAPLATGANLEPGCLMMRGVSNVSYVLFRPAVTTANAVTIEINSASGSSLGTATIAGLTHATSTPLVTKAGCYGNQLHMKVWRASDPEPPYWHLVVTDPTPQSGWIGMRGGRAASNTNASAALLFYDFMVENPQRVTVTRSVNGVVRAHEAGSDVRLWSPLRLGR